MYYPEELIEEIRQKNDIVDVVSGYVHMQKKGSSYFGLCPFHNEKSPSFSVSPGKQMYYCFGCGAGGNVFTFVMQYENYTFPEAVKLLAERAGVSLPEAADSEDARRRDGRRARLLEVNKEAAKYYYYMLRSPRGSIGQEYLAGRRLSREIIDRFGLGFSGITRNELVKHLKSKGYEDQLIMEAGLAGYDERQGIHDNFWNRVIFPIQDINHRVIGFGGRVMGDAKPKYLNSPESMVFDKSRNLYGLNFARTSRKNNIILCEGYMDVIAMHQAGFNQAVASLGTAFTEGQAGLLKRYAQEVLLAYDSDEAGTKAALRAIGILKGTQLVGKIINLEPYKDPDELIKALGPEGLQERIDRAENSFFFELRLLERRFNLKDPEEKTRFHREIAAKLCEFAEDVERENYMEAVAERYRIEPGSLRRLVSSHAARVGLVKPVTRPKSGINAKERERGPEDNALKAQRLLLTWLSEEPELYGAASKYVTPRDFTDELCKKAAEAMYRELEAGSFCAASVVSLFTDEEEQRKAAEAFNTKLARITTRQEKEKAFHDILYTIKENSYEYHSSHLAGDLNALSEVIQGKKELEELRKTHISLE